ncbi:potassium-transporting ATPase subunit C [Streptomyces sp. NPDC006530]|uniref:potassium-transporting ATPase subunit C n=1 Tax=Streptomyces sp. NPDC006530 TaxID=3364750 RepID=UPI003694578D
MNNSVANTARVLGAGLRALLALTLVCGVIYPLLVTGVAQLAFPDQAKGSEIKSGGKVVGSALIGQTYNLPKKNPADPDEPPVPDLRWFQPRPSHGLGTNTLNTGYQLLVSGATNLSADNEKLVAQVEQAKEAVVRDNSTPGHPVPPSDVPADAVTSSGSGLDPEISPAYAKLQIRRVAEKNHLDVTQVETLVTQHTHPRTLGFLGEPGVNVLELNVALGALARG